MAKGLIVVCRVTTACNLACGFCAFDRRLPFARVTLTPAQLTHLIDLMASAQASGKASLLSWLGGEPLLWREWPRFSAIARAKGIAVSATSNGSNLHLESVQAAVLQQLDELTLSVDAVGEQHDRLRAWPGGFARLLPAVRRLAERRMECCSALRLRANIVLMRSSIVQFAELCTQLADAGFDEISFNLLGGRDRPDFFAQQSVALDAFDDFTSRLPALRAWLAARGVHLVGSSQYLARLRMAILGRAWPIDDCAPGTQFLFVDEWGRVSPCPFTSDQYGITLDQIDDLSTLPDRFAQLRRWACASACQDCPSTQLSGKFTDGVDCAQASELIAAKDHA